MHLITESNLEGYLKDAKEYWGGLLTSWQDKFSSVGLENLGRVLSEEDEIFRIVSMIQVYVRAIKMLDTVKVNRVEMLRDYAQSFVLTAALSPRRSSSEAGGILLVYENTAWAQVLKDLRIVSDIAFVPGVVWPPDAAPGAASEVGSGPVDVDEVNY